MKKSKSLTILISLLLFVQGFFVHASFDSSSEFQYSNLTEAEKFVCDSMTITAENDWETWANCFSSDIRDEYIEFVSDIYNKENHIGIFALQSAEVIDIIKLNNSEVDPYYRIDELCQAYQGVQAFIVGLDCTVIEENGYFFNGINYRLVITAQEEDGIRKIQEAHCSEYMLDMIDNTTLSTEAVDDLNFRQRNMLKGYIPNETLKAQIADGVQTTDDDTTPSIALRAGVPHSGPRIKTIRVKMTRLSGQPVHTVDIIEYSKVVLANEVPYSWHENALGACGLATKMYGIYRVLVPKYPNHGDDVKDTSADQNYNPNGQYVGNAKYVNAIESNRNVELINDEHNYFCTYYKAGPKNVDPTKVTTPYVANESHPKYCGDLSQNGAQYLASHYNYYQGGIIDFYYSYSHRSDGSNGVVCWVFYQSYK